MISGFLKRDSYVVGIILAFIIPLLSAVVFLALNYLLSTQLQVFRGINDAGIILLSIGMNLIAMRFYLVKYKLDKTGRGILAVTFIMGILFFIFLHGKDLQIFPVK